MSNRADAIAAGWGKTPKSRNKYGAELLGRRSKKERIDVWPKALAYAKSQGWKVLPQFPRFDLRSNHGEIMTTYTPDFSFWELSLADPPGSNGISMKDPRRMVEDGRLWSLKEVWDCKAYDKKTQRYRLDTRFRMIQRWLRADWNLEVYVL